MTEEPTTTYYWKVFFRNDKMGFQKSYEVVAYDFESAVDEAVAALEEAGYSYENLSVVTIQRIREVGT